MYKLVTLPFAEQSMKPPLPISRLDKLMYGLIAERRASNEDKGDLLSMLLVAQDNESDGAG